MPSSQLIAFSPTAVTVHATQGTTGSFSVTITLSDRAAKEMDHVKVRFDGDLLEQRVEAERISDSSSRLTFFTHALDQVGTHTSTLDFIVCKETDCATSVDPSPTSLPLTILVAPAPPAAVVTPGAISSTVEANDTAQIALSAQIAPTLSAGSFAFGAHDAQGRFAAAVEISSQNGKQYSLLLKFLPNVPPGTYSGTLALRVCSAYDCAGDKHLPGSPVVIPYTVTVTPEVVLQPRPSASGLPEWETHQGNAGHTGYVPVTLDPTKFVPRWSWTHPWAANLVLSPATTGSGKVFVTTGEGYAPSRYLIALRETDGSTAWQHDFGDMFVVNHPAAYGGRVFVATAGQETAMWSFDADSGTLQFKTTFDSQLDNYLAPTIKDGYVYTNGGMFGGMYAFKGTTGNQRWFAQMQQYDLWTPAVDDDYAYGHTGYEFAAIDRRTGARAFSVSNPSFNWAGYALNSAPVLPGDGSVLAVDGVYNHVHANNLIRYSIAAKAETWRLAGSFVSSPAVAAGRLYVLNAGTGKLEARDSATGASLWTWAPGAGQTLLPGSNLVVTDNLVFLSTTAATYAISLASHQAVWSTPRSGKLALSSNRVLYVVDGQRIDAFSLF